MHLRDLIREHISVIIMRRHSEPPIRPSNQLHRRSVGNQMLQLPPAPLHQSPFHELLLILLVEHAFHRGPITLLPLKHRLLCHHIWRHAHLQTPLVKNMRQIFNIIVRIVIHHAHIVIIRQVALVHHERSLRLVVRDVSREQRPRAHFVPTGAILSSHGMPFEQYRVLISQFDTVNVYRVSTNRYAVPALAHGAVGTAKGFFETHFFDLDRGGCDGGFFENRADAFPGGYGGVEDGVVGGVAVFAGEIVGFPRGCVEEGGYPLVDH
mmetsp:Transcript_58789/g.70111  ORF Transcript_58789/g.70111 Transcript_58789/m.70111 type:complete len:266 (+) Transcript_58789:231-1028(+)